MIVMMTLLLLLSVTDNTGNVYCYFMLLTFPGLFGICCEIPENARESRGAGASECAIPFCLSQRFNPA